MDCTIQLLCYIKACKNWLRPPLYKIKKKSHLLSKNTCINLYACARHNETNRWIFERRLPLLTMQTPSHLFCPNTSPPFLHPRPENASLYLFPLKRNKILVVLSCKNMKYHSKSSRCWIRLPTLRPFFPRLFWATPKKRNGPEKRFPPNHYPSPLLLFRELSYVWQMKLP